MPKVLRRANVSWTSGDTDYSAELRLTYGNTRWSGPRYTVLIVVDTSVLERTQAIHLSSWKKGNIRVAVAQAQTMPHWITPSFSYTNGIGYYASKRDQIASTNIWQLDDMQDFVATLRKRLAKPLGLPEMAPHVPWSPFTWIYYTRFPTYRAFLEHGIELEIPPDYPHWFQTFAGQPTPERALSYLFKDPTRAHMRHITESLSQPNAWPQIYTHRLLRPYLPGDYHLHLRMGPEENFVIAPDQRYGIFPMQAPRNLRDRLAQPIGSTLFGAMSPKRILRIGQEALQSKDNWRTFMETLQLMQYHLVGTHQENIRVNGGLEDFHNQVVHAYNNLPHTQYNRRINPYNNTYQPPPPPADRELPKNKLLEKVDGTEVAGLRIVVPKNTKEIRDWGAAQRHCLGGYAQQAASGHIIILAFYKGDKLESNAAIQGGRITQFRGQANAMVDLDIQHQVEEALQEVGLLNIPLEATVE